MFDDFKQVDIALIAPSRAGKTTLICAMKRELEKRLARREILFSPRDDDDVWRMWCEVTGEEAPMKDMTTAGLIGPLRHRYENSLKIRRTHFRADDNAMPTRTTALLSFDIQSKTTNVGMPFRVLDYPGGSVVREDADAHTKVLEKYSEECFALVVPVFSLALVEQYKNLEAFNSGKIQFAEWEKKDKELNKMLQIDDVIAQIVRWCRVRAEIGRYGILVFAPVKCETFFGGDCSANSLLTSVLERQTKEAYFKALCNELSSYNQDILDSVRSLISVVYSPVLTFGEKTIGNGSFRWEHVKEADEGGHETEKEVLRDYYEFLPDGNQTPMPSGAAWIINHIVKRKFELLDSALQEKGLDLQSILNSQNAWERFWGNLPFGKNGRRRQEINRITAQRNDNSGFVREIASMDMSGCRKIREESGVWSWDSFIEFETRSDEQD